MDSAKVIMETRIENDDDLENFKRPQKVQEEEP
jgi:hypothetical protein